ncbi:MBL fold metallo-hydrolase RNA specificity domain-containing protein [Vibrio genomosp. F6]|uniref:MBL fold hydrolase n=1 Tax=Vibrio genomosp. F6 str. FF-238 TaxID=1191298 RepID=A0A1E5D2F4_9VIBR|nr:MBL fold metallo-hydrolase [Vibrio genomosp. F6]OEE77701.1 MBL fold hydrolase [Vibrio genomosp. F6 str. FF-238]
MEVIHHGGKDTVTGSCHELKLGNRSLLIDCGLFQGSDSRPLPIEFPTSHIKALIATHTHIDHIGRLPWLLVAGFKGPIYCTPATAELIPLMLEDGLKLQLGLNRGQRERVLELVRKRIKPVPYHQWLPLSLAKEVLTTKALKSKVSEPNSRVYIRFSPAGHILGSAYVEIKLPNGEVVVFSGDLGPRNTPLLPDPKSPKRADYLYIETTYGDKNHDSVEQRSERMKAIINRSLKDGGTILIPAFSVGRTQELLFDIERLIHQSDIEGDIPIILDSPLASKVTKSYRRFKKLWGKEAKFRLESKRHPLAFEQCVVIDDHKQHIALVNRLATTGEAAIVIAASGMCQGGRVMNYLKALLPGKRTDVLFAGYQAHGTLGREIQSGRSQVVIDGQEIEINAQRHTMSGYSAHADQADLLAFIRGIESPIKELHLIHGEPEAKQQFMDELVDDAVGKVIE